MLFYEGDEEEGVTQKHLDQAKLILQEAITRFKEEYRNQMSDRVWGEVKQEIVAQGNTVYNHCKGGYDKWNRKANICMIAMLIVGLGVGCFFLDIVSHLKPAKVYPFMGGLILLPYLWSKRQQYLYEREYWGKKLKDFPGWR